MNNLYSFMKSIFGKYFVETTIIGYIDIFYTICNCFTNTKQSTYHFNQTNVLIKYRNFESDILFKKKTTDVT